MKSIFTFILFLVITIATSSAQTAERYLMSAQKLEVRSGPGANYNIIAEVPQGTQVYVLSSEYGAWSTVQYKSVNGFVLTKLLMEDNRIADAERAAKEASAKREAAKAAARKAIADAQAARKAAEEAAARAIAEAERQEREAQAQAERAIAEAEAAMKNKDVAARRAMSESEATRKALIESNKRTLQNGDDLVSSPIESTTPSYGSSNDKAESSAKAKMKITREDKFASWEKKSYKSGATPNSFGKFKGKFNYKLDNYLKITVEKNTEVVVKLYKMGKTEKDDELIRIAYINSNTTQYIRNIPEGEYFLKIAYGNDWRETTKNGKPFGTFTKNALYEKGEEILNYNSVKTDKGINVPSYSLTLGLSLVSANRYGNEDRDNISPEQFNNDF